MKRFLLILLGILVVSSIAVSVVQADGIFQSCTYCNDCNTFLTEPFKVKNYKKGILVTGSVPDAELSGMGSGDVICQLSGKPLEIIITTGDVHTRCHNTKGIKEITGDILWRGAVTEGQFTVYLPLEEGKYNITVYMGQSECANCPQAWVVPLKVKHKSCDWIYRLKGSRYNCYLEKNSSLEDTKSELPTRYRGTEYMESLCTLYDCDGNKRLGFDWIGSWTTVCKPLPPCTACP